jgi:hypothetical protein
MLMSEPADGDGEARSLRWWRDIATVVAILGLFVTMVFNTLGVRQSAASAKATRAATEISVLTSLSSFLEANDARLATPHIEAARCDSLVHPLSPHERLQVLATLDGFDYLAWLFNQPDWRLDRAKRCWAPQMLYAFDVAKNAFQFKAIESRFAQLNRFQRSVPHSDRLIPNCPP